METRTSSDPVSMIIKACHRGEAEAQRIYHLIAEERRHRIVLDDNTHLFLSDRQIGEFAARFSSEVEPEYWVSKRLKH